MMFNAVERKLFSSFFQSILAGQPNGMPLFFDQNPNLSFLSQAGKSKRNYAVSFLAERCGIPKDVFKIIVSCFPKHDDERMKTVLQYFIEHSDITRLVSQCPGSAIPFEYLYHAKLPEKPIDEYFVMSKAGASIPKRLYTLVDRIPFLIRERILKKKELVNIDNVGSGPGRDMLLVLERNPDLIPWVHVRNIDPDREALEIGMNEANRLGISRCFSFEQAEFKDALPRDASFLLVVGVLCGSPQRVCEFALKKLSKFVTPNGLILFSTVTTMMGMGDPITDFIMRFSGWHMDYKPPGLAFEIAKNAGLKPVAEFFEDDIEQYHSMVIAQKT